jgi:PKD repeat protein
VDPFQPGLHRVNDGPGDLLVQFTSTTRTICQGGTVTFTDNSYNGVSRVEWSFAGGTPATCNGGRPGGHL